MANKLPYPDFSKRDNDWLYVYDQQLVYYGDNTSPMSRDLLLKNTMRQIKDSGIEAYELFGDPAAQAEEDLANSVPPKLRARYGIVASPAAVAGAGVTYLAFLGLFASARILMRTGFSFDLTVEDIVLPLVLTVGLTTLLGVYGLVTSGLLKRAFVVLSSGVALVVLGCLLPGEILVVSGFPTVLFCLLLLVPAVIWWRWRNHRAEFRPVDSAEAWYSRFEMVLRFRYRVAPGPYVDEVREHCSLTGATPQEEFGHPELYAYELERIYPDWGSRRRNTVIFLLVMAGVGAFIGLGYLADAWANAAFFSLTNLLFYGQYTNLNRRVPEVSPR